MPRAGSACSTPYTPHKDRKPLPKVDDLDNDKHSMMSHGSGSSRVDHGYDALRRVAGNRVRHGRCAPEFLEEIASRGVQTGLKKNPERRFKVISGLEARSYFKDFVRDHQQESDSSSPHNVPDETTPNPIVFAVTVWGVNTKCVDYYMTWRGKMKADRGKDAQQLVDVFDYEFRKLAKGLDREYKAISSLRNFGNISPNPQKFEKKAHHPSHKSRPPPGIMVSTPEEPSPKPDATQPALPEPPASATDSVMSLPLLNMIRGVPFSHRVPLKVMNPDRFSIISENTIIPEEVKADLTKSTTSLQTLVVPTITQPSKHDHSSDILESSASIRSSGTRSTLSSRSSRSSSRSENRNDSRQPSPDGHKHRSHPDEIPEFMIVLLGDKFDNDPASWHGLERQVSIRSLPADRHSPWLVPVVRSASTSHRSHRSSPAGTPNDSESEESENEGGMSYTPVIPMKPLMEAMGIMPSLSHYHSPPVVPGGLQYQLSIANATSPPRAPSPFLYGSPSLEPSNYVPAWLPPGQVPSHPPSRPVSHAYSSASFSSPYMQSHTGLF